MSDSIRIGTRNSPLAIWQAEFVKEYLHSIHIESHLVFIKSEGEQNLTTPLYELGVQGVFTKALDVALLENRIDIAVHSLKDVPTSIAQGLEISCIPPRANPSDTLVYKSSLPEELAPYAVATSSLRRKAQWLNQYPFLHHTESIRGNINTRLQKLMESESLDGVIFATAGLDRIALDVPNRVVLDWMIPAPAQGALGIMIRLGDNRSKEVLSGLHCDKTAMQVGVERMFLRALEGGCTMPIGALVQIEHTDTHLKGCILDPEGQLRIDVEESFSLENWQIELKKITSNIIQNETFIKIKNALN